MRWFFGIVLLLGGGLLGVSMLAQVVMQDNAIRHFVPVDAVVVFSDVKSHHGSKSTTYTPIVRYQYRVRGVEHDSDQVTAFYESGSSYWARRIVGHYPAEARTTAYVNPNNSAEAILVREYSSTPYFLTCIGICVTALGGGILFIGPRRKTMRAVLMDPAGWQLLLPAKSMKRSVREAWLLLLTTGAPMAALVGHLVWVGRGLGESWILIAIVAAGIAFEVALVWWATGISRSMSDPRVMVNPAPLRIGETFGMRVEFDAYRPLVVEKMRGRVMCVEHYQETRGGKTVYGTRDRTAADVELGAPGEIASEQIFSGEAEVTVQAGDWPASSDLTHRKYPYFTWELRLNVMVAKRPDYYGVFPLEAVVGGQAVAAE